MNKGIAVLKFFILEGIPLDKQSLFSLLLLLFFTIRHTVRNLFYGYESAKQLKVIYDNIHPEMKILNTGIPIFMYFLTSKSLSHK